MIFGFLLLSFGARELSRADGDLLKQRSYILPPEVEASLLADYDKAANSALRGGNKLDRGPARYFLETNGITFAYKASAELKEGQRLNVKNSEDNLRKVDELFEKLYLDCFDLERVLARVKWAQRQPGPEVFVPSELTISTARAKSEVATPTAQPVEPFDSSRMDFARLVHGSVIYTNVKVTEVTPASLTFIHPSGATTVPLAELTPEVQRRYGYDPTKAQTFLDAQARPQPSASPLPTTKAKTPEITAAAESQKAAENSSNSAASPVPVDRRDDKGRLYERILCRDGRVFEDVVVTPSRRSFRLIPSKQPKARAEEIGFDIAPSSLLLDFDEFDELFRRVVVANRRTQLYELTRDGIEGGKPFQDLAKDPSAGISFVSVPEGYVFSNMNWISLPAPAVEFVVPLGSRTFAVADATSLVGLSPSEWWNKWAGHGASGLPVPGRLQRREPGKNSVLYSPFSPDSPILGNSAGEMKRLWVDAGSDKNGRLALVETGNGLFFGYYREHAALENSELTWADATRQNSGRFALAKISTEKVQPGGRVLKLFEASAKKVLGSEFKELGQLKLGGQHFKALLEKGVEAAVQDRVLPKGDGVQFPEGGFETDSSLALDKITITDQVDAKLKDVLPHAYVFDVESRQRVIEIRKENSGSGTRFQESRPQRRKQNEVVEVPPDLDGGLRLTDGQLVYELKPALGGTELVVWEAQRSQLRKF